MSVNQAIAYCAKLALHNANNFRIFNLRFCSSATIFLKSRKLDKIYARDGGLPEDKKIFDRVQPIELELYEFESTFILILSLIDRICTYLLPVG